MMQIPKPATGTGTGTSAVCERRQRAPRGARNYVFNDEHPEMKQWGVCGCIGAFKTRWEQLARWWLPPQIDG